MTQKSPTYDRQQDRRGLQKNAGPIARMARSMVLRLIAASTLGIAVAFGAILLLNHIHASASEELKTEQGNHLQLVRYRDNLRYEVIQVQQFLTDVSATRAQNGLGDGFEEAEKHAASFRDDMSKAIALSGALNLGDVKSALEGIQAAFPIYYDVGGRMAKAYVAGGPPLGNALMPQFDESAQALDTKLEALDKAIQPYEAQLEANAIATRKKAELLGALGLLAVAGVGTVNIAIGLAVLRMLNRRLLSPVSRAVYALKRLTEGDYSVAIDGGAAEDEIGDMARALRVFKDSSLERIRLEGEMAATQQKVEAERMEAERQRLQQEVKKQEQLQRAAEEATQAAEKAKSELVEQHAQAEEERRKNELAQRAASDAQAAVVSELATALSLLASGDLTVSISKTMPAEYRKLKDDFDGAVSRLRSAMQLVTEKVARMNDGASEITVATDDLSKRTEGQAASLEQTAAALNEITSAVLNTAKSAKEAANVVGLAKDAAQASGDVVKSAILAMKDIETSASQINKIIGVIDEIAFQTNLLALNAGVEAARAGDAGRGFAVVASEVGALARRSAQSAKEIKSLITTSTDKVGEGSTLVSNAGDSLLRIIDHIGHISIAAEAIATSADSQSVSLRELNTAVTHMDRSTQQNAAMVEQTTAATRALAADANELANLVSVFRVETRSPTALRKAG